MRSWNEIDERFNCVKDTTSESWQKIKKLSTILADAYHLNENRASEMWQYLIDTHQNNTEKSKRYYTSDIFDSFEKYKTLRKDEAVTLLSMNRGRLDMMLKDGYSGYFRDIRIRIVIMEYLKVGKLKEAVEIVKMSDEKWIRNHQWHFASFISSYPEYKQITLDFWKELQNLPNKYISEYARNTMKDLISDEETKEYNHEINIEIPIKINFDGLISYLDKKLEELKFLEKNTLTPEEVENEVEKTRTEICEVLIRKD